MHFQMLTPLVIINGGIKNTFMFSSYCVSSIFSIMIIFYLYFKNKTAMGDKESRHINTLWLRLTIREVVIKQQRRRKYTERAD